ncbi:polar amino acid transport system substrate-binding protein [Agrobacterium vitis]|nr:polar amino acid transport system substrate-binding protein [Agrobacterium vitis]MBE1439543.1 polar amino acid transport system substrate-binding protein [Agrobacterium vitis]
MSKIRALADSVTSILGLRNALASILLLMLATTVVAQDRITFTTEDYPPYNFVENGVYKGIGYDQIILIMQETGIDYTIELMPWARAYALAQSDPNTCVFTAAHTPERDSLFKWVEPLGLDRNVMTSKAGSGIHIDNIEQARRYRIGTQRDDYTEAFLRQNGFEKIDLAASLDLTLKKLESGRIDLIPLSEKFFYDLVKFGRPLEKQFILTQQTFALACSKSVPDALIARMQTSLNALIADGRQKAIFDTYGMTFPW